MQSGHAMPFVGLLAHHGWVHQHCDSSGRTTTRSCWPQRCMPCQHLLTHEHPLQQWAVAWPCLPLQDHNSQLLAAVPDINARYPWAKREQVGAKPRKCGEGGRGGRLGRLTHCPWAKPEHECRSSHVEEDRGGRGISGTGQRHKAQGKAPC